MRVVVTGGAGFLGSHLVDRFLAESWEVVCLDNLITGDLANIDRHRDDKKFIFIKHDVTEHIKIDGPLDWVLHFASPASPIDYQQYPIQTLKVGSLGTHNALGLAKAKKAKFFLASTSEVYGDPLVNPQPESYWGNVNPIGPRGVYDEAKRFAEAITMAYRHVHGLEVRIIRIFNTFGPRMRWRDGRVVPNFIVQALQGQPLTVYGDGHQTRSFGFVADLVEGVRRLMQSDLNEPVNIGNPEERTVLDLAKMISELAGGSGQLIFEPRPIDDPKVRRPDISKAKKYLDWQPQVDLKDGLRQTIEYFRERLSKGA